MSSQNVSKILTDSLAAQEFKLVVTIPVVPLPMKVLAKLSRTGELMQAVLMPTLIVWFSRCPECVVPGGAVRPLPSALLPYVFASKPGQANVVS